MIIQNLIDTELTQAILDLPFVDRYAGMTKVLTQQQVKAKGSVYKKYPVACCVTERDCIDNNLYSELTPDDSKKSVIYWEMLQPMQNRGFTPNLRLFNTKRFTGRARLVVWLNLAALGWQVGGQDGSQHCNGSIYALPSLMNVLSIQKKLLDGVYAGNLVKIEPRGIVTDLKQIFGKYDYPKDLNYHFYPFGYFAIDVDFQLDLCLKKELAFPVANPIDCIDYSCDMELPIPTDGLVSDINADMGVNGTTPNDGDRIALIVDQTGLNNSFVQANTNKQPIYTAAGIAAKPSILFDATYIENTNLPIRANTSYSIWTVFQRTGAATGNFLLGNVFMFFVNSYTNSAAGLLRLSENFFSPTNYTVDSTFAALKADVAQNTLNQPYLFGIVKDGNNYTYYINNTIVFTASVAATGTGAYGSLGSWSNSNFTGYLSRLLIYNKANTAQEIQDITNSLIQKYNL